jgi:hypothetical protein
VNSFAWLNGDMRRVERGRFEMLAGNLLLVAAGSGLLRQTGALPPREWRGWFRPLCTTHSFPSSLDATRNCPESCFASAPMGLNERHSKTSVWPGQDVELQACPFARLVKGVEGRYRTSNKGALRGQAGCRHSFGGAANEVG